MLVMPRSLPEAPTLRWESHFNCSHLHAVQVGGIDPRQVRLHLGSYIFTYLLLLPALVGILSVDLIAL